MFKRKYRSNLISQEIIAPKTAYIYINKSKSPTKVKVYKGFRKTRRPGYLLRNWYPISLIGLMTIILILVL